MISINLSAKQFDEFDEKFVGVAWSLCVNEMGKYAKYIKVLDAYRNMELLAREERFAARDANVPKDQLPVFEGITLYDEDILGILAIEALVEIKSHPLQKAVIGEELYNAVLVAKKYLVDLIPTETRQNVRAR